jgi:P-type conjugative transfer protein TrbJ
MIRHRPRAGCARLLAAAVLAGPLSAAPVLTPPAQALFGFGVGRIVYDPTNHAETLLTAARALEQVNNQIAQLQNEAQMLVNDARNLANLPDSGLAALQASVARTQGLLEEAQRIAYDVADIDRAFSEHYGLAAGSGDFDARVGNARQRWETSVAGFEDALKVQAGVVGNMDRAREETQALVAASQDATGALQAAQAGNQLLALQSQQLGDLVAVIAASERADALEAARAASAQAQAQANLARFLAPRGGYWPGDARMFRD